MIFVIGGTGTIGRGLLGELAAAGAPARVLVRTDEKAASVEELGFEAVPGDLERQEPLAASMEGATSLFLLSSQHPRQAELQNNAVAAAEQAGVERIVKVSSSAPVTGPDSLSWAGRAHAETEQRIMASGIPYALLRPSYFMQNMLALAEPIRNGALPVSFADARVALIDTEDVAAVAARILLSDGRYDNQVYALTGPEAIPFAEVAARLSRVLGHEIAYTDPPVEATLETMRARGAPDWLVEHIQQILVIFRANGGAETSPAVEEILGRPARTIEDFARAHADALGGGQSST
jgi:uncharacterized protein YbjT (DUF2867 family)